MDRWRGKVTGASEGVGAGIVRRLAKDGMKVAALARRPELLEALEQDVKNSKVSGTVKGYVCDVGSWSQVEAVFKAIEGDLGAISVLVNNAGVFKPVLPTDMDLDTVKLMTDTNLNGVLYCTKAALAVMKRHSINDGHIVNISSYGAHSDLPLPVVGVYKTTKHALNVMSSVIREQLKKEKSRIRITVLSPALVKTSLSSPFTDRLQLGQYMLAEDVADAVAYTLATPPHVNALEQDVKNSRVSGTVKGYVCDVGSWSQVEAVFKAIEGDLGAISVLVNNAGVFKPVLPTETWISDTVKLMIDTNLNGVLYCSKAALAAMKNHSINDGHIVNISSYTAHTDIRLPVGGIYKTTKHAVNVMSSVIREQLKKEKSRIRVIVLSPALVKTSLSSPYTAHLQLGQYMLPEDVADVVAYTLATPPHVNISQILLDNADEFPLPNELKS